MGVAAAPRIDDRLGRFIAGSSVFASPAEVTRAAGDLAWQLGLPRPSYQQVLVRMGGARPAARVVAGVQTTRGKLVLRRVERVVDALYEYPGPGLEGWYRRYMHGAL